MDQIYQLQRQIQDLRQEVNTINQVAGQLQRSEANNASQLQRLQQNETIASQQLQAIQQICNRLSQDVNAISNVAQQVTTQMFSRPFSSGQFGTGAYQQGTGHFGTKGTTIGTGYYNPSQFGSFGSQFGTNRSDDFSKNQQISSMAANRYGVGFSMPDYASNQQINSMVSQGLLGSPQGNVGTSTYGMSNMGTSFSPTGYAGTSTGNFSVLPSHPSQTSHYASTGFAGSQNLPMYSTNQMSTPNQLSSSMYGSQSNIPSFSSYNNF